MIILLLGAPGAGKGTQADILSESLSMTHVASGDLLREHRRSGTPLGKLADSYIQRGELVPDDVVIEIIIERLQAPDCVSGVILDGFPRTLAQAAALDTSLSVQGKRVDRALYIKVSHDALVDRLAGRWMCRKCHCTYHEKFNPPKVESVCDNCGGELYQREDDRRDVVEHRLNVYFKQTVPVIEYYRRTDSLVEIDGEQEIEKVTEDLMDAIRRTPSVNAEGDGRAKSLAPRLRAGAMGEESGRGQAGNQIPA